MDERKPLSLSHSIPKELEPIPTPVQDIVRDVKSRQTRRVDGDGWSQCSRTLWTELVVPQIKLCTGER